MTRLRVSLVPAHSAIEVNEFFRPRERRTLRPTEVTIRNDAMSAPTGTLRAAERRHCRVGTIGGGGEDVLHLGALMDEPHGNAGSRQGRLGPRHRSP